MAPKMRYSHYRSYSHPKLSEKTLKRLEEIRRGEKNVRDSGEDSEGDSGEAGD